MGKDLHGAGWAIDDSLHDLAYQSSPDAQAAKWRSPVLFIHGDDDRNAPFNQTTDMVRRLRAQGVSVETLILPDEDHDFLRYASFLRAYAATAEFLQRTLGAPNELHSSSPATRTLVTLSVARAGSKSATGKNGTYLTGREARS